MEEGSAGCGGERGPQQPTIGRAPCLCGWGKGGNPLTWNTHVICAQALGKPTSRVDPSGGMFRVGAREPGVRGWWTIS